MHLYVLLTLLIGALLTPSGSAAEEPAVRKALRHVTRVRPANPRIAAALAEGRKRSALFRAVVDRVEQLDVIVYAETQPQLRGRLSGSMIWVTATKAFRYVRVSLNPDLSSPQLAAALAHELQHVVEVGEAQAIVDTRTLSQHYQAAGLERRGHSAEWDTEAAKRTGEMVRRELAAATDDTGAAESIQTPPFDDHR